MTISLRRLAGRLWSANFVLFALMLAALLSAAGGIASVVTGLDFRDLAVNASLSLVAGWMPAASSLRGLPWGLTGLITGAGYVIVQVGQLTPVLWAWSVEFVRFSIVVQQWKWAGPPDAMRLSGISADLYHGVVVIASRVVDFISHLPASRAAIDLVTASLIWSFLIWVVAYWAAGAVRRYGLIIASLVPAGGLLGASLAYNAAETTSLLPFLGSTMLILVVRRLGCLDQHWSTGQIDYPEDIWVDMGAAGVSLATLLVFVAMAAPPVNWSSLFDSIQRIGSSGTGAARSSEFGSASGFVDGERDNFGPVRDGGLPRDHLIGSGPELRDVIVMSIKETELAPDLQAGPSLAGLPPRYWRSLTYDIYNGRGWEAGETETVRYPADSVLISVDQSGYRTIQQEVAYQDNLFGLMHFAGIPLTVDAEIEVAWRRGSPPSETAAAGRPASPGDIFGININSTTYRARTLLPLAGSEELRAAGEDIPADLMAKYTRLPGTVPERVLALARDLTVSEPTPYDQAVAIESYLRAFPYNLDLPAPPGDRDIADYFLFELQQGYCDYYATAMVVLARAAGLPARMVTGFAAGRFDSDAGLYQVSAADAHSWVEIFFAGYGWIEFEPTGGLPPIQRDLLGAGMEAGDSQGDRSPDWNAIRLTEGLKRILVWAYPRIGLIILSLGLASAAGYWLPTIRANRLKRLEIREMMFRIFTDIYHQGNRLMVAVWPGDTVYEFGALLQQWMATLDAGRDSRSSGKGFSGDLDELVDLFARVLFSRQAIHPSEKASALKAWIRLQRNFRRARLKQALRRWVNMANRQATTENRLPDPLEEG